MNLFSRMALLGATALVALSLPAYAVDATLVKSGATPQLSQRADHPAAFKRRRRQSSRRRSNTRSARA